MADDLPDPVVRPKSDRLDLRADCARCVGLCCVAPAFAASADFAIDKPAGVPCPNLGTDFGCTIHPQLRERGFPGCTVFDCFGAGQQVVQRTFGGLAQSDRAEEGGGWRQNAQLAAQMFDSFTVMRQLHELLWYLTAALTYPAAQPRWPTVERLLGETERLTVYGPAELVALDLPAHRSRVADELRQVSAQVRAEPGGGRRGRRGAAPARLGPDLAGRELIGKDLRTRDLRRADLRGSYLLGADLRGVDLARADLIGADLRAADLRGADLAQALFVTQMQVNAARGDAATTLPGSLTRPPHWTGYRR